MPQSPSTHFTQRTSSLILTIWLGVALVLAYLGYGLYDSYQATEQRTIEQARMLVRLVERQTATIFRVADLTLLQSLDELQPEDFTASLTLPEARRARIESRLFEHQARTPGIVSMSLTDAKGYVFANTVGAPPGGFLGERGYFLELKNGLTDRPSISDALLGRISNKWGVQIARPYMLPNGNFGGMLVANLGLEENFLSFFSQLDIGRDAMVSLRDLDNKVIVRHPHIEGALGKRAPETEAGAASRSGVVEGVVKSRSGYDNVVRYVAFRRLAGYPVYARVGLSVEQAFALRAREVATVALLALLMMGGAGALTLILHQRDSDRRDLLEQKERAETEQRRFEALATGSPVGVWQNDADGNCVYVNPRGCEITGLTVEQIMAQGWRQAIHAEDREAVAVAWSRAEANGQPFHCEYRISRPDGNVVWVLGLAVPLVDAAGKRVGHVGTLTDITKSKLQQDEISDLNLNLETRVAARTAALERANRELESFSYSVSHDLRAPLRAINGYAKVLLDEERGRLGEEGQRMLDRIAYNADRMGELIDDILDYSRVGRSEMHLRDVDLERLLGHVVARLRESHPRVKFFSSGLPVVLGDATMLEQILQNLLDNACTYTANTEDPRIEIAAETRAGEQLILVRDNGVGFDMEHAGRLFGLFQRLHAPVGRDGTGVGLAIVKRLVERHGGRIWAESAPGEGACFYFSLAAMPTGDAASGEVSSDA